MFRHAFRLVRATGLTLASAALLCIVGGASAAAQAPEVPADRAVRKLPRQHLSGPRFGFTTFTGDVADRRRSAGKETIMSQFGWQFETQIMSTASGNNALLEWVFLVGGVEQDELNLSLSWLAGLRTEGGVEFGAGPNLGLNKEGDTTTSMVVAAGSTLPFGDLFIPVNVAIAFAEGGPRITSLIGWIIG